MFKNKNVFIQFEIWKDCRQGCKFCFNKKQKDVNKNDSLQYVLEELNKIDYSICDEIGLIGGEIFDNQLKDKKTYHLFIRVLDFLIEKIKTKQLKKVYLATNLVYDINPFLIRILEYIDSFYVIDNFWICTSHDIKYRYKTTNEKLLWHNNVLMLKERYPNINIHIEIIMTQFFIDAVLNNTFSITEFKDKYSSLIDYIDPMSGYFYNNKKVFEENVPGFFPTKESFIKFLKKTTVDSKEINIETFLSIELRSSIIHYIDQAQRYINDCRRTGVPIAPAKNKNICIESGFIDSDISMQKVVENFKKIIYLKE